MALIYKIFRPMEYRELVDQGTTLGAPIDLEDGYIHFSTSEQVRETAEKHFAGAGDLKLVAVEADALGSDLVWEPSRGGALFPHLYRALTVGDAVWVRDLIESSDGYDFGDLSA